MCSTLSMGLCLQPQGALQAPGSPQHTRQGKPQHSPSTAGTVTSTMACLAYSHSCPSPWPASSQAHSMQVHSSPSPVHTWQAICAHLARHPGLHVHHSSHPNAPQQPSADTLSVGCPSFPANIQLPTSAAGGSSKGSSCPLGLRSQFPARPLGEGHFPRHLSQASGRAGLKARPISCLSSSAPHPIPDFLGTLHLAPCSETKPQDSS